MLNVRAERNVSIGMAGCPAEQGGVLVLLQVNSQTAKAAKVQGRRL
jgi:hypothetical protein